MTATADRPKKLLSLDGGGIRGVMTLGILAAIEAVVRQPLGEYFDYIAGTSTGAIMAAGLAQGLTVRQLQDFYIECGPEMFEKQSVLQRHKSHYKSEALAKKLQDTFVKATTLGSSRKPLLLIVTRNGTTDSPWPISSNPDAIYNDRSRPDCNLNIPLWQLVRASTAAPVYFPAEVMHWDPNDPSKSFVFVDGGVTPYNNPAFLLYKMATVPEYRCSWPTGERKMLIVSAGTGSAPVTGRSFESPGEAIPSQVLGLISTLMYGAEVDQDISCRTVGRCTYGNVIDNELGDMIPRDYPDKRCPPIRDRAQYPKIPLSEDLGKAFLYARYNPVLNQTGLRDLGFRSFNPDDLQRMDLATPDNIRNLGAVGKAVGELVHADHFGPFLD